MRLIVNPHKIEIIKDEAVNEREIDISKCTFEFAEEITQEYVKEAYFTYNGETYKQIISNNECKFPSEVLEQKGMVEIGVVAYLVENDEEIKRYNPSPAYFNTLQGSLKDAENSEPITPSEMEQFEQQLQNGLNSIDDKIDEVDTKLETVDTKIDEIDTAIEETNNLDLDVNKQDNKTTVTLTKKNGSTKSVDVLDGTDGQDGTSLEFMWQGTSLGIKTDDMQDYVFVDLQGIQGPVGETGAPFTIKKTYSSIAEMNADFDNMELGDYVMIASSVELEDNAKLFTKGESAWIFITDFSGAMGIRGETGLTPNIQIGAVTTGETSSVTRTGTNENPILNFVLEKGEKGNTGSTGPQGETGNGIASVTKTSTSGLTDTYTITYTNGNTSTFNVKNGKGISSIVKTSTSGLVDTYTVTFNDNTTMTYTVTNGKDGIDGEVTQEQLDQVIKDLEYWKTTNNALPKVEDEDTDITLDNTANSPLMLGFKASDTTQESTTGKNLLNNTATSQTINGLTFTVNIDGTVKVNGTATTDTYKVINNFVFESGISYVLSGCPSNGTSSTYFITLNASPYSTDYGNGVTISTATGSIPVVIGIKSGATINNLVFKPMIRLSSITDDTYEPYTGAQPSPNPDYPQEIHTVRGDNEINVKNKNLCNGINQNVYLNIATEQCGIEVRNSGLYIEVSGGNYTISTTGTQERYRVACTNVEPSSINVVTAYNGQNKDNTNSSITIDTTGYKYLIVNATDLTKIQIEKGSVATTYTPHQGQNYPISLGVKNLSSLSEGNNIVIANNLPAGTYTFSVDINYAVGISLLKNNSTGQSLLAAYPDISGRYSAQFTVTETTSIFLNGYSRTSGKTYADGVANYQIEEGSIAHSYTPYGQTPIEMCKISTYADEFFKNVPECEYYDSSLQAGKWYKLGKIGKVVLDGSENWSYVDNRGAFYRYYISNFITGTGIRNVLSNYFTNRPSGQVIGEYNFIQLTENDLYIQIKNETTLSAFKTWLSTHNTIVYYILTTPTKTPLSDTLQTQLDNISYAMAYQDQTNISQVNEDRPFIISASTIKDIKTLEDRITALEESISL